MGPRLRDTAGTVLTDSGPPLTVTAVTADDGRAFAVTVIPGPDSDCGTVELWDLTTMRRIGAPLAECDDVHTAAMSTVDGSPVVVTAGWDDTVRMWDPVAGRQIGAPVTVGGAGRITTAVVGGRPVAITAGRDEDLDVVRVWDLVSRRQLGQDLVFPYPVRALAAAHGLVVGYGQLAAVLPLGNGDQRRAGSVAG